MKIHQNIALTFENLLIAGTDIFPYTIYSPWNHTSWIRLAKLREQVFIMTNIYIYLTQEFTFFSVDLYKKKASL